MKYLSVHSQLMYWVKADLHKLYNLKIGDPTKVAQQVKYLLEGDRYQCDPKEYEVCFNMSNGSHKRSAGNLTKRFTCSTSGFSFWPRKLSPLCMASITPEGG